MYISKNYQTISLIPQNKPLEAFWYLTIENLPKVVSKLHNTKKINIKAHDNSKKKKKSFYIFLL